MPAGFAVASIGFDWVCLPDAWWRCARHPCYERSTTARRAQRARTEGDTAGGLRRAQSSHGAAPSAECAEHVGHLPLRGALRVSRVWRAARQTRGGEELGKTREMILKSTDFCFGALRVFRVWRAARVGMWSAPRKLDLPPTAQDVTAGCPCRAAAPGIRNAASALPPILFRFVRDHFTRGDPGRVWKQRGQII